MGSSNSSSIVKKNGKIRICGDYKLTINAAAHVETYPLPRVDELYAKLNGGKYLTKLDLSNAYLHYPFIQIPNNMSQLILTRASFNIIAFPSIFATHELPRKLVTGNGPSFTSEEFRSFLSGNGITQITTAPYHPSSNGLAERAVQTVKQGLKCTPGGSLQERLSKFLLTYRITPQSTTGVPPATLLMGCRLRTRLDQLFPDLSK